MHATLDMPRHVRSCCGRCTLTCAVLQLSEVLVALQWSTAQLLVWCDDVQAQVTQPVGVVLRQAVRGSTVQQHTG
jgi:hypothetical protein